MVDTSGRKEESIQSSSTMGLECVAAERGIARLRRYFLWLSLEAVRPRPAERDRWAAWM